MSETMVVTKSVKRRCVYCTRIRNCESVRASLVLIKKDDTAIHIQNELRHLPVICEFNMCVRMEFASRGANATVYTDYTVQRSLFHCASFTGARFRFDLSSPHRKYPSNIWPINVRIQMLNITTDAGCDNQPCGRNKRHFVPAPDVSPFQFTM